MTPPKKRSPEEKAKRLQEIMAPLPPASQAKVAQVVRKLRTAKQPGKM